MMDIKEVAKKTRWHRKIHRIVGSCALVFFLLVAVTGLLLAWKKNSNGYLQAKNHQGTTTDMSQWLSLDTLTRSAILALQDSVSPDISTELDRIDVRPDKGMIKFTFTDHYWGVQVDAATAAVLHIERRRADFIEQLHDGSLIDKLIGNDNGIVKLSYSTITAISLLLLTITGFWLWYNPKRIRKKKQLQQGSQSDW
jgi:hypothetical protein